MTDSSSDRHSASTAGDRAELERDAERAALIKREETLAWCYQRQAEREAAAHEASKPRPEPSPRLRAAAPAPATVSAGWASYIDARIKQADERTIKSRSWPAPGRTKNVLL